MHFPTLGHCSLSTNMKAFIICRPLNTTFQYAHHIPYSTFNHGLNKLLLFIMNSTGYKHWIAGNIQYINFICFDLYPKLRLLDCNNSSTFTLVWGTHTLFLITVILIYSIEGIIEFTVCSTLQSLNNLYLYNFKIVKSLLKVAPPFPSPRIFNF